MPRCSRCDLSFLLTWRKADISCEPPLELWTFRNRGNYTIAAQLVGSEKYCLAPGASMARTELLHSFCKRYVSDSAGEEIAAGDVARCVPAENDGSAERALEFIENRWFEDGRLLP